MSLFMLKKIIVTGISILALIGLLFMVGPHPSKPVFKKEVPAIPQNAAALESYIAQKEKKDAPIKPGNEAKIIWVNDSTKQKAPYALVYLHGFSASHEEGNPVHRWMASTYGMNLYLARLADHGRAVADPLLNFTAASAWADAVEAVAIGKQIGEKVIILSTSTGGTLSLMLAAHDPTIHAQVLLSPNIAINDPNAWLLNDPWGFEIAKKVIGSPYKTVEDTTVLYARFWDAKYRVEALVQLQELIETSMTSATFKAIHQPTLLLYYFKDKTHQDPVVRVDAMLDMFHTIQTPEDKKKQVALADAGSHVIGSSIKSKDLVGVKREIATFLQDVLGIATKQ